MDVTAAARAEVIVPVQAQQRAISPYRFHIFALVEF